MDHTSVSTTTPNINLSCKNQLSSFSLAEGVVLTKEYRKSGILYTTTLSGCFLSPPLDPKESSFCLPDQQYALMMVLRITKYIQIDGVYP
jgi:hypothetical protein